MQEVPSSNLGGPTKTPHRLTGGRTPPTLSLESKWSPTSAFASGCHGQRVDDGNAQGYTCNFNAMQEWAVWAVFSIVRRSRRRKHSLSYTGCYPRFVPGSVVSRQPTGPMSRCGSGAVLTAEKGLPARSVPDSLAVGEGQLSATRQRPHSDGFRGGFVFLGRVPAG